MLSPQVIIIGAGPAGCACALQLAQHHIPVLLLEKATFPRDKICGDALSVDVLNQLPLLSKELAESFETINNKMPSSGVKIIAPNGIAIDIPFLYKNEQRSGFICPRLVFDDFLFQEVKRHKNIRLIEGTEVQSIVVKKEEVEITSSTGIYKGSIVVGADGAHSIVTKQLADFKIEKKHYSAGLRMYYENVTGFNDGNFIELYFFKETLPGYLWVFPLKDNKANIGIGMVSSVISRKKVNLKQLLPHLLQTHPLLKERFKNARPLEEVKGFGLPLGSRRRNISGERFLLVGDAASLIDPFTGEGIGNAIRSGRIAGEHIVKCIKANNFSAAFNKNYDREVYLRMGKELQLSRTIQRLCTQAWLFNWVANKTNNNKRLHRFFIAALADINEKKKLVTPKFYIDLLLSSQRKNQLQ